MNIHAFSNYKGGNLRNMKVIGRVISKGQVTNSEYKKILNYDTRQETITIQLDDHQSVRLGDRIYIIKKSLNHQKYKDGYIVAEGEIYSIFKTEFQGWMMKAKGFFSQVFPNYYGAIDIVPESRNLAYVLLRKGDRSFFLKDYAKALAFYQNSLSNDKERPETYLKLANVNKKLGLNTKADHYIHEAWKRLHNFEDTNAFLQLPGIYLASENQNIKNHISKAIKKKNCTHVKIKDQFACKSLKQALFVLQKIRNYKKRLNWFQHTLSSVTLKLLTKKGIPDYEFQYNFAVLLLTIKKILNNYLPRDVIFWLTEEESSILYTRILLPDREKKSLAPKKIWDEAYLQGVFYHLELAYELNPIDPRAGIKIVQLCYNKLKENLPKRKQENYINLAQYYGKKISNLYQIKGYNWALVRLILNKISQF